MLIELFEYFGVLFVKNVGCTIIRMATYVSLVAGSIGVLVLIFVDH